MIDLTKVGEFIQSQKDRTTETKLFMGELMNKLGDAISNHITPYVHGIVKLRDVKEIDLSIFNTPISLEDEPEVNLHAELFLQNGLYLVRDETTREFEVSIDCLHSEHSGHYHVVIHEYETNCELYHYVGPHKLNYAKFCNESLLRFVDLSDLLTEK